MPTGPPEQANMMCWLFCVPFHNTVHCQ